MTEPRLKFSASGEGIHVAPLIQGRLIANRARPS